jgi:hypothetical protein
MMTFMTAAVAMTIAMPIAVAMTVTWTVGDKDRARADETHDRNEEHQPQQSDEQSQFLNPLHN